MSLVDYAAAARKRVPGWQGVAWQPGLWLAWAVIILAIFAAVAPGLLTHYSPIEGIAGAQRLAPQAGHWLGTDQLGRDVLVEEVGHIHFRDGLVVDRQAQRRAVLVGAVQVHRTCTDHPGAFSLLRQGSARREGTENGDSQQVLFHGISHRLDGDDPRACIEPLRPPPGLALPQALGSNP